MMSVFQYIRHINEAQSYSELHTLPFAFDYYFLCINTGLGGPERCSYPPQLLKLKCYYTSHVSKYFPIGLLPFRLPCSRKADLKQIGYSLTRQALRSKHSHYVTTVCIQNHVTVTAVVCLLDILVIMFSTNFVCQIWTPLVEIKAISTAFPTRTW